MAAKPFCVIVILTVTAVHCTVYLWRLQYYCQKLANNVNIFSPYFLIFLLAFVFSVVCLKKLSLNMSLDAFFFNTLLCRCLICAFVSFVVLVLLFVCCLLLLFVFRLFLLHVFSCVLYGICYERGTIYFAMYVCFFVMFRVLFWMRDCTGVCVCVVVLSCCHVVVFCRVLVSSREQASADNYQPAPDIPSSEESQA